MKTNLSDNKWLAKCAMSAEAAVADELKELGASNIMPLSRAVSFEGDLSVMYKANVHLRCAIKILKPLFAFDAKSEDELYQQAYDLPWEDMISPTATFAIEHTVRSNYFKHSQYAALKLKDAIVDRIRKVKGCRPSVDIKKPVYKLNLQIGREHCNISLDTSGNPLFMRGYRTDQWKAPIKEDLAATFLHYADWKGEQAFLDPMCGSGTFIIEAAMMAANIPPNLNRAEFAFERWPNYNNSLFEDIIEKAEHNIKKIDCPFIANDIHAGALQVLRENIRQSGIKIKLTTHKGDFKALKKPYSTGLLMMNPPYDKRLETPNDSFYKEIGDWLKKEFSGWKAGIIAPAESGAKSIGLRPSIKKKFFNGAIDCTFMIYELYKGTKN